MAWLYGSAAFAEEPPASPVKNKNVELSRREEAVKKEEERLNALKADVDKKIAEYEKLLKQLDAVMAKLKDLDSARMNNIVKTYESMPPENAAKDIESLDEELAASILIKMKNKKAGAVLAAIGPKKAATLTELMSKSLKNLPIK
jgi:flagellar motility protein MotE (MotC chaperone)